MGRPVLMLLMFLKLVKSKRGTYDKLISMLLRFIADKGPDFSLAFRILNVDIYSFPIRITIKNCPEKPLTRKAYAAGNFLACGLNLKYCMVLMTGSCVPNLIKL